MGVELCFFIIFVSVLFFRSIPRIGGSYLSIPSWWQWRRWFRFNDSISRWSKWHGRSQSHRRVSHGPRHSLAPLVGHDVPGDGRRGPRPRRGRVGLQQSRVPQPSSFNGPPGYQRGGRRSRWFPQYQSVSFAPFILNLDYIPQCVEQDLNKSWKARPKTPTASKVIPYGTRIPKA